MTKQDIYDILLEIYRTNPGNIIDAEAADDTKVIGLKIYDEPIMGIASADDKLFEKYREPGVIGPHFLKPADWLPTAKTVISFFMPFSEAVKKSNASECEHASLEWAYARIEGQAFLAECTEILAEMLREKGIEAIIPGSDPRFGVDMSIPAANWSERHAAFAAGLGTFGKSKALITEKGMAGRISSLIISEKIEPDKRPYNDIYEYCIDCGACARRCPAGAIPKDGLKDHSKCAPVIAKSKIALAPRYGCGLCQTGVPCESEIPKRR